MPIYLPPTRESYSLVIRKVFRKLQAIDGWEDFSAGDTYWNGVIWLNHYAFWFCDPQAARLALVALYAAEVKLIYTQPDQRLKLFLN